MSSDSVLARTAVLTAVELRKVLYTRGSQLVLLCTAAVGLLISAALTLTGANATGRVDLSGPMVSLSLAVALGTPLIGVLIMTGDWNSREAVTLFLLEPRRVVVFASKVVATAALSAATVVAVILVSGALAAVAAVALRLPLVVGDAPSAIGPLLVVCFVGAISGAALASVIMSTPLAVAAVIIQTAVVDPVLSLAPVSWSAYLAPSSVANYLEGTAEPGPAITALVLWIVLPLTVGLWRTCRKEVR
jgi:hypothetical protein